MPADFERNFYNSGLSLKLYRGVGMALLAFDLDQALATPDFVGFAVECKPPREYDWQPLLNRLRFDGAPAHPNHRYSSLDAPFQKFRWIHLPNQVGRGDYGYRVTARYMRPDGSLVSGASVMGAISLDPVTISGFVNVGFTRGFASSQAYAEMDWPNREGILPPPELKCIAELAHPVVNFQPHYGWLGFEARRLLFNLLESCFLDEELTVEAMIYECREPAVLEWFEKLGPRLRALIDDHGENGEEASPESESARRLIAAGAQVKRTHFKRQQHNKVLVVKRKGVPVRTLAGSTNFSLRGLCIQANNMMVFEDARIAKLYADVFDAYWNNPKKFHEHPLSQHWHVGRDAPDSRFSFCFSPHQDESLSLDPVAQAIEQAESSVLYAVVFLPQLTGTVKEALDKLTDRALFSYGVAQRTGSLAVQKPDGSRGLLPFACLGENAPEPFKREWSGGECNMLHHKFVVTDFNGAHPKVFTGSSNLVAGGERENGDHIVMIEDRKVAIAYAIEALRLFDHFHFRVRLKQGEIQPERISLVKPPNNPQGKTWFSAYFRTGHVKERDRRLFSS